MAKIKQTIKDLKQVATEGGMEQFKALFETIYKLNENMLFIQRNQCEIEAYLSLIAEKTGVDTQNIQDRIKEIEKEFDD